MARPAKPAKKSASPAALAAIQSLRTICRALNVEVEETTTYGNPAFRTGKRIFAVLDHYDGADCLWLHVHFARREVLLNTPGWFASPYDPMEAALCCRLDAIDWRRMRPLVRESLELCRRPRKERHG